MFAHSPKLAFRLVRCFSTRKLNTALQITNFQKSTLLHKPICTVLVQHHRLYKTPSKEEEETEVNLMEFQPTFWPGLIPTLKNWFFAKIIIQPYFDSDFSLAGFITGAKQALVTISTHLSAGRFDLLDGLVTNEALQEIQRNFSQMDVNRRMSLQVMPEDIFFFFPYQIGIILNEQTKQRFAEILVVYHCMKDYKNVVEAQKERVDYKKLVTVCNYRFVREYTKGVDGDWTVNLLNHFRVHNYK